MNITNELRKHAKDWADEVEIQLEDIADRIDKKLSERYVEYQTDADGTPIHEGDKLVYCGDDVVLTVDSVYYVDMESWSC